MPWFLSNFWCQCILCYHCECVNVYYFLNFMKCLRLILLIVNLAIWNFLISAWLHHQATTLWSEKTPKCFSLSLLQNPTDSDKIWYILSLVKLSYRNVNVFHLTWIMSLHYLVKISIRVLQVNSSWNCKLKNTKMFLSYLLQNEADSDKVWYIFSWFNLPWHDVNASHLTWMVSLHYLVKRSIHVLQVNGNDTLWVHCYKIEVLVLCKC